MWRPGLHLSVATASVRPVILRATYRQTDDHDTTRVADINRPDYDGAWHVARAETRPGEHLIHVRTVDEA